MAECENFAVYVGNVLLQPKRINNHIMLTLKTFSPHRQSHVLLDPQVKSNQVRQKT